MSAAEAAPARFVRTVLLLAAAGFLFAGLAFGAWPTRMAGFVEMEAQTVTARGDVRAVFGGLELGVGVFLLLSALRRAWFRAGLALQLLAYGGLAGGRVVSLALDGAPAPLAWGLLAAELAALGLGGVAWARWSRAPVPSHGG